MNFNYLRNHTYTPFWSLFFACQWTFLLIRTAGRDINSSYINDVDSNNAAAHITLNIAKHEKLQVSFFESF